MLFFERETLQRSSLAYDRPNKQSHRKILDKFFKRALTSNACEVLRHEIFDQPKLRCKYIYWVD